MRLVLDASATLSWLFLREDDAERACSDQILSNIETYDVEVPNLWLTEVTNALLVGERRKIITLSQSMDFVTQLCRLPICTDKAQQSERVPFIMAYAREFGLSSYDATYLDLALRKNATLATFDRKLADAAKRSGATVLS